MSRGNCKQIIYHDNDDYEYFLALLDSVRQEIGFSIHAMCLMRNHFHLLIETRDKSIGEIMKPICQYYTQYYNRKYDLVGHLFQGRYKSSLVESERQFLLTSRYIHLNPVKAKIVLRPEEYKWTSYRCIVGDEDMRYIERERTLSSFGESQEKKYRAFVNRKLLEEEREEFIKIQKEIGESDEGSAPL